MRTLFSNTRFLNYQYIFYHWLSCTHTFWCGIFSLSFNQNIFLFLTKLRQTSTSVEGPFLYACSLETRGPSLYIPATNIWAPIAAPQSSISLLCGRKMSPAWKPGNCGMIRGSPQCILFLAIISHPLSIQCLVFNTFIVVLGGRVRPMPVP